MLMKLLLTILIIFQAISTFAFAASFRINRLQNEFIKVLTWGVDNFCDYAGITTSRGYSDKRVILCKNFGIMFNIGSYAGLTYMIGSGYFYNGIKRLMDATRTTKQSNYSYYKLKVDADKSTE
ncbi:unnamed protein product [Cunninghamella echinulata]